MRILTTDKIVQIYTLRESGRTFGEIARLVGYNGGDKKDYAAVFYAYRSIKALVDGKRSMMTASIHYIQAMRIIQAKGNILPQEKEEREEAVTEQVLAKDPEEHPIIMQSDTEVGEEQKTINKISAMFENLVDELLTFAKEKVQKDFLEEKVIAQEKILDLEVIIKEQEAKIRELEEATKTNGIAQRLKSFF